MELVPCHEMYVGRRRKNLTHQAPILFSMRIFGHFFLCQQVNSQKKTDTALSLHRRPSYRHLFTDNTLPNLPETALAVGQLSLPRCIVFQCVNKQREWREKVPSVRFCIFGTGIWRGGSSGSQLSHLPFLFLSFSALHVVFQAASYRTSLGQHAARTRERRLRGCPFPRYQAALREVKGG